MFSLRITDQNPNLDAVELPASTLAEDIDYVAQAFGTLQPVLLQASFDAVRITLLYALDDVFVLFDGEMKILND